MTQGLTRNQVAWRIARDIPEGAFVNLGIGQPVLVANFVPAEREVVFHSENGILGMGPEPPEDAQDEDLINAGKQPVTLLPGASLFHHADSFAMMRGGISTSASSARSRSRPTATSPTGRPARPTRSPASAARWTSRSARRRSTR